MKPGEAEPEGLNGPGKPNCQKAKGMDMKRKMKKIKKILASPVVALLAFVCAAGLLLFSSIGGARAALTYYSETYSSNVELSQIGVRLVENGTETAGELLLPDVEEDVKLGKSYKEELAVRNSGEINQFVRVTIYKYWLVPGDGTEEWVKSQELGPELINLHLILDGGWMEDEEAATPERTVLYYRNVLKCGDGEGQGETSPLFADSLTIDGRTAQIVRQDRAEDTVRRIYAYDGAQFCIEIRVDAVQEHNAEAAVWSAWGRKVRISDGILSLE